MKKALFAIVIFLINSSSTLANCTSEGYNEFDFWLGDWQVTSEVDDIVRFNTISKVNNGCTILEEYTSPSGYVGKSLNIYDQQTKQWHQSWTDSSGLLLQLQGSIKNDSMVMEGEAYGKDHQIITNKISWTPNKDGSVRQHWQISQDKGKTWQTAFDGTYRKIVKK